MQYKSVPQMVQEILQSFLKKEGYELYDVTFAKESGSRFLRVTVDKEGGVGLQDCEKVSRFLSKKLDEMDPIKENYFLEVSSPGAERIFKKESDFVRFKGSKVKVTLNAMIGGQKMITGKLLGKEGDTLRLRDEATKKDIALSMDQVARVKNILEV